MDEGLRASTRRRGNALFLALIAVLAVSAMAAAFLQLSLSATRRQAHSGDVKQAFYLAEAGLATPTSLNGDQIAGQLLTHTPLPLTQQNNVIDSPLLSDANKRDVLIANSPLKGSVKSSLNSMNPPMNQADYDLVMAAQ